jgi:hypothetical protein
MSFCATSRSFGADAARLESDRHRSTVATFVAQGDAAGFQPDRALYTIRSLKMQSGRFYTDSHLVTDALFIRVRYVWGAGQAAGPKPHSTWTMQL